MRRFAIGILFLLIACCCSFATERNLLTGFYTQEQVSQSLLAGHDWVNFPAYSDRSAWDVFFGDRKEEVIRRGEKKLTYKWRYNTATDYLAYERTGERKIMEEPQSANNIAINDLLMAELAEGQGRFLDQLINAVWMECERTSWVLSAHLHRQPDARNFPNYHDQIVDLGSGEVAGMMAWVWFFLHEEMDKVNPVLSERLRTELHNRITVPYFEREEEWWLAFHLKPGQVVNNWNPWCNFCCLEVIMLIEDDPQVREQAVWRSMRSVDRFLNYIKADGACEEGPSYWGHAAGKLFDYLDLLNRVTNHQVNLFGNPQVRAMGEYIMHSYVYDGWVVNFADASARYTDNLSTLVYRYAEAIGSEPLHGFAAELARKHKWVITGGTDIYRTLEGLRVYDALMQTDPKVSHTAVTWYPETQFCYMNKGDWFVASKGGHNNESHNHNDVGTCTIYYKGVPLLIDAGVGTYTKQTFSSERYSIWTMQSGYHNLPIINGIEQHNGESYRCTKVNYQPKKMRIDYELAGAYPAEAGVKSWVRGYEITKKGIKISDIFSWASAPTTPNELHFLVWYQPEIRKGEILLKAGDASAGMLYDASVFDASFESVPLDDKRLSNVWGEQIYRIILKAKNTSCQNYTITIR